MPVFFIHSTAIVGKRITILDPLLTHLSKSLRICPNDTLILNDEVGHRYLTKVGNITAKQLQTEIQEIQPPPPSLSPTITLGQALLKGEKMGWVIQKATELGVRKIIPLQTDRVIPKPTAQQAEKLLERWGRIALEAAQQSEQWYVPEILPLQPLHQFLRIPCHGDTIVLTERQKESSLLSLPLQRDPRAEIRLVIGPEGGWSVEELQEMQSHHLIPGSLGETILRSETASLAGIAILQARLQKEITPGGIDA